MEVEIYKEQNEQYNTDGAICPYCGYLHEPGDTDYLIYDENLSVFGCHNCGNEFNITLHVSHSWTTTKVKSEVSNGR